LSVQVEKSVRFVLEKGDKKLSSGVNTSVVGDDVVDWRREGRRCALVGCTGKSRADPGVGGVTLAPSEGGGASQSRALRINRGVGVGIDDDRRGGLEVGHGEKQRRRGGTLGWRAGIRT
jgi:hypothetical protein